MYLHPSGVRILVTDQKDYLPIDGRVLSRWVLDLDLEETTPTAPARSNPSPYGVQPNEISSGAETRRHLITEPQDVECQLRLCFMFRFLANHFPPQWILHAVPDTAGHSSPWPPSRGGSLPRFWPNGWISGGPTRAPVSAPYHFFITMFYGVLLLTVVAMALK